MKKGTIITALIMITLMVSSTIPFIASATTTADDPPINVGDANIAGTVVNGTAGLNITISSIKNPPPPAAPVALYFNTTTDGTGSFNQTVDSRDLGDPPAYTISPYQISVRDDVYYLTMVNQSHFFVDVIEAGQTQHVPVGGLEAANAPIGNLSVRILNGSSGQILEGAVVTVSHVDDLPDMPFATAKPTNGLGEAYYADIRSVETRIEATKLHFQDLSETVTENTVIISEGGDTIVYFNLTEDPWPFTTSPGHGSTGGNVTNGVLIDFGQEMDLPSITNKNNFGFRDGSMDIEYTIVVPDSSNDRIRLVPTTPLDYNSSYEISIYATLNSFGGGNPLWRTMDINFTTELPPGIVSGRLVDDVDGDPAPGLKVQLVDQVLKTAIDGTFSFPLVIPGEHDLDILDGYLYDGREISDIDVERGDDMDLGDIVVSALSKGSLNVTVTSRGTVLPGAWVKVISSILDEDEFVVTTESDGIASFPSVRSGNVNLRIGALHHESKIDAVIVPEGGLGLLTVELIEDDFPVGVSLTDVESPGIAMVGSDFQITLPEPILFQSLDVVLWKLNATGGRETEIALSPPQEGSIENSYIIRVQGQLPYSSYFDLVVDSQLETLDDGELLLWRDLVFSFESETAPDAFLNGTVLLEGKPLEGVKIEFEGQFGTTDDQGRFNVSIHLLSLSKDGRFIVNLTDRGYRIYQMDVALIGGQTLEMGSIDLIPIDSWYDVSPANGVINVGPETDITFNFMNPITEPSGGWSEVLKIVREGTSAPISGTFTLSGNNLSIVFKPSSPMLENNIYHVSITNGLLQGNGLPFFPVGNETQFKIRPRAIMMEVISPSDLLTEKQHLDQKITISFGLSVDRSLIEEAIDISPSVEGITFNWVSHSEVIISALYAGSTSYSLTVPPGVYGLTDEPLGSQFQVVFETDMIYGQDHSFSSINLIPDIDSDWETDQSIKVSGTVDNSTGYEVKISIGTGSDMITETSLVAEDGTWSVDVKLPSEPMTGTMTISIGVPGGPSSYSRDFDIDVRSPGDSNNGSDPVDYTMYYIAAAVVFILIVVIAGVLYMKAQRKKAEEEMDIEITEVDGEWEDPEE